jgi:hypothetical protein
MCYWSIIFTYTEEKLKRFGESLPTEIAARMMGQIVNLLAALLLLPASRSGLWVSVFGISYERALKYHRILGLLAYVFLTVHGCIWWSKWWREGSLGNNIVTYNKLIISPIRTAYQDFSIPIAELQWVLMTVSLLLAVLLRRRAYEVFQYSHKFFGVMFYVTAVVHAWSFWYASAFLLPYTRPFRTPAPSVRALGPPLVSRFIPPSTHLPLSQSFVSSSLRYLNCD